MAILDRVRRYAHEHQLWSPSSRVIAAVSGGSDSIALLFILRELAAEGAFVLCRVAHLDHRIRGDAGAADATFCRDLAIRLSLASSVGVEHVPTYAAANHLSIEVAARQARHRFLATIASDHSADLIALAHTRDDQAETVLLRLLRGAGPLGLSSIAPRRGNLIRPLLECSRAELQAYLTALGQPWREDETNEDRANPRNRIRHEVLPLLRHHFNPQVDAALARTADISREDHALLTQLTNEAAAQVLSSSGDGVALNLKAFRELPVSLARRIGLRALETANPGRSYGLEEADAVRAVASGGVVLDLAGIDMERSGHFVVIKKRGQPVAPDAAFELALPVPGSVEDPRGEWELSAEGPAVPPTASNETGMTTQVAIDAERISSLLHVRSRRPGDRLQPLGMTGRKKVQDLLVDRKVPRDERDRVPIVTAEDGEIVWVAGHALHEGFRVTPRTTTVVRLTLRRKNDRRPS